MLGHERDARMPKLPGVRVIRYRGQPLEHDPPVPTVDSLTQLTAEGIAPLLANHNHPGCLSAGGGLVEAALSVEGGKRYGEPAQPGT